MESSTGPGVNIDIGHQHVELTKRRISCKCGGSQDVEGRSQGIPEEVSAIGKRESRGRMSEHEGKPPTIITIHEAQKMLDGWRYLQLGGEAFLQRRAENRSFTGISAWSRRHLHLVHRTGQDLAKWASTKAQDGTRFNDRAICTVIPELSNILDE